jgi:hypothetical protein
MSVTGTSKNVHGYLVTGDEGKRWDHWTVTCAYANWLETRGETAHVMCFDDTREHFLEAARRLGLTVQVIEGAGDDESYRLLIGGEGTGWAPPEADEEIIVDAEVWCGDHGNCVNGPAGHLWQPDCADTP